MPAFFHAKEENRVCAIIVLTGGDHDRHPLGIGVAAFIVDTGFHLSCILSVKRSSEWMRALFQNIEGNLNAAVAEFRDTLENQ